MKDIMVLLDGGVILKILSKLWLRRRAKSNLSICKNCCRVFLRIYKSLMKFNHPLLQEFLNQIQKDQERRELRELSRLAHLAFDFTEIVEACVDDDDTDDDDDYDDDFYDCVDIEEDGGEIDLDISKIRLHYLYSGEIYKEADVTSFSDDSILRGIESDRDSGEDTTSIDTLPLDDSMILPEYESFTFDDEPVMAEVNTFDEINTSELSFRVGV
ncbi:hypothetical protein Tco_0034250 [Tanacetum coccineum]